MIIPRFPQKSRPFAVAGIFAIAAALTLLACYPGDPISATDLDLITTFRNPDADFSTQQMYAMPDTLLYLSKDGVESGSLDPAADQAVLAAIDRNMQEAGYQKVADPANADVLVVPLGTTTKWTGGSCYPWYWDWWYTPYPGWCYPVVYNYTTATLLITMVDASKTGNSGSVEAMWIAGLNGILASGVNTTARIDQNINQAFEQSPYLKDGK
jgi:hypothetical protein